MDAGKSPAFRKYYPYRLIPGKEKFGCFHFTLIRLMLC